MAVTDQHAIIIMGDELACFRKCHTFNMLLLDVFSSYSYIFWKKVQSATSQSE